MEKEKPPAYQIASVGRALTLLSAFAGRRVLSVSEAAEMLDVAPSTAHRMLQMLVYHGFVVHGEDRSYRRGPAIEAFRSSELRAHETTRLALPRMIALRDELEGGTPHLMALEGNGGRFVAGVQAEGEVGVAVSRVGWLLPAHTLAGGKALLAGLPPEEVDALYPDGLPITRYGRLQSMEQLHRLLDDVRVSGFAISREAHRNVYAIGVAIPALCNGVRMALSVGWNEPRYPTGQTRGVVKRIQRAAADLASILGSP